MRILPAFSLLLVALAFTASSPVQAQDAQEQQSPLNRAALQKQIDASYYHPDQLQSLSCAGRIDWASLFAALQKEATEEKIKVLDGLVVRSHAVRDHPTEITFEWTAGKLDSAEQIEQGARQMVGGFYEVYWNFLVESKLASIKDATQFEPLKDGGLRVTSSRDEESMEMVLNKDHAPTHFIFDLAAMKGTIDVQYTESPVPVPGDLRRIGKLEMQQTIGKSALKTNILLDYQKAGSFLVPRHVQFQVVGAYSVAMDFSACTAK